MQASNENNVNLTGTYTWDIKSAVSADYAFGTKSDVFLSLNNSKEISLGSIINENNQLYIEPAIELIAGTRYFYETYTIAKAKKDKANGKGPKSPGNSGNAGTTTETVESQTFNLLSYNLKLPLGFSRGNYLAEMSYQLSILGPKAAAELKNQQSLFGLAFYYQF